MTGSQEALILFAVVVLGVAFWKGQQVNIPFVPGGTATGVSQGAVDTGVQP